MTISEQDKRLSSTNALISHYKVIEQEEQKKAKSVKGRK